MEQQQTDETKIKPKAEGKRLRLRVILLAVVCGGIGIFLILAAQLSDDRVALINAIAGVLIAILALLLSTEEVTAKVKPSLLEASVIALGFFALGQAFIALGLLTFLPK